MCFEWNLFCEGKSQPRCMKRRDHVRTRKSPRRVRPVSPMTLLYVLLSQVIFHPLRLSTGVSESDAVIPNVTATPPRPELELVDGVDLPEELPDREREPELLESVLCERECPEFSSILRATSRSAFVHTSVPSSDLRSESSDHVPSSWMSDMAR